MFRCGEAYFSPEYKGRVWRLFLFVCPVNVKKLKSRLGFRVWGLSFGLWVRRRGKSGRCHGLRLCFEDFGFLLCFGLFAFFEVFVFF